MSSLYNLRTLPSTLPVDGVISIDLEEGIPIFRVSSTAQRRLEELLSKQQSVLLSYEEEQELGRYEEINHYLRLINRAISNLLCTQAQLRSS